MGNQEFNRLMQAHEDISVAINKDSSLSEREAFIRAKYIQKAFIAPTDPNADHQKALYVSSSLTIPFPIPTPKIR